MKIHHAFWSMCVLVACSGEGSDPLPEPDGGNPRVEADAATEDAATTFPNVDAGDGCAPGAHEEGTFGAAGGSVSLCGATASFAPNVLSSDHAVRLEVVALEGPIPYPLVQGGLAFRVEVEGGVPSAAEPPLALLLPHDETTHYKYFYRVDEQAEVRFQEIEACTSEAQSLGQNVYADGSYVVLFDKDAFNTSSDRLGTGSLTSNFGEVSSTFDLASDSFDTYAIYNLHEDGSRTVTLAGTTPEGEDTRRMKITFDVAADGSAAIIEVSYGTLLGGLYSYLPFDAGPSLITISTSDAEHLVGSFDVEVRLGEETARLSGSFDARPGLYRFPPSLSCGALPEG